ncbi:DUF2894 domain-containing protein [Sorangium cellulosum]|uniref:DUF2894 domain-containing protein n=1 Tax=Sorangium cellulosum TaxID=56 RepID=UPI003D9A30E9
MPSTLDFSPLIVDAEERQRRPAQPRSGRPPQPGSAAADPQPGSVVAAAQPRSGRLPRPGSAAAEPQPGSDAAAQPRSGRPPQPGSAAADPQPGSAADLRSGSSTTPHPGSSIAAKPGSHPRTVGPGSSTSPHPGSSATPHSPHPLPARLAALQAAGAHRFDPASYRLIEALLERAGSLDGGARARLAARAADRLAALEASFHRARAEAEAQLRALADAGIPDDGALAAALALGDLPAVARAARRRLRALAQGRQKTAVPSLARLRGEIAARDVRLPEPLARDLARLPCDGDVVERRVKRQAQALSNALSTALFHESLVSARATLAVARAADNVPEDAGPYNAQVLAARALCAAERLSEPYLRALVASLQDLGALAAALEPPPEKPTRKKAAPRSARDVRNAADAGARRRPARKKESLFRGSR